VVCGSSVAAAWIESLLYSPPAGADVGVWLLAIEGSLGFWFGLPAALAHQRLPRAAVGVAVAVILALGGVNAERIARRGAELPGESDALEPVFADRQPESVSERVRLYRITTD
jgi:hypothetical protein